MTNCASCVVLPWCDHSGQRMDRIIVAINMLRGSWSIFDEAFDFPLDLSIWLVHPSFGGFMSFI